MYLTIIAQRMCYVNSILSTVPLLHIDSYVEIVVPTIDVRKKQMMLLYTWP